MTICNSTSSGSCSWGHSRSQMS